MIKFFKKYSIVFFSFFISFLILLITSKNSFLYEFNDWVDANAFFTVGKSMFRGLLPYKDLFEQKGILLYFIYGLGSLLSYKTFYGVFIIEVCSFSITLIMLDKLIRLFLDKKYSYIILPIFSVLITTDASFVHGGSCEEFCLPFLAVSLYYFFKHYLKKPLTKREFFINGLMCGCVFIMKYTIILFWFGFMASICINELFINKNFKNTLKMALIFLLGMCLPFFISCIYYIFNNGLKDYIYNYFIFNMSIYRNKFPVIEFLIYSLNFDKPLVVFLIIMLIIGFVLIKMKKYVKLSFWFMPIFMFTGIYIGGVEYLYYELPLNIFIIVALVFFFQIFEKSINRKPIFANLLIAFSMLLSPVFAYFNANYREELFYSKDDYYQFKYAKYINKYSNATLLNMNSLDCGLYTLTGIIPSTYYFEVQNISYKDYPDNLDSMKDYVNNKKIDFIVYILYDVKKSKIDDCILDNYDVIYSERFSFEKMKGVSYLLKKK